MPKVYITQKIKVDFQQAAHHGEPVFLTHGREDLWSEPGDMDLINKMWLALSDFDEDNDFIVLTGSPYVNATAMLLLGRMRVRSVQFLRWNNSSLRYERLTVSIPFDHEPVTTRR